MSYGINKSRRGKPMTDPEMLDDVVEEVLSDTMQDMIMSDILMEIIQNNEVSKIVDRQLDLDRLANKLAESIMRDTVLRMLE